MPVANRRSEHADLLGDRCRAVTPASAASRRNESVNMNGRSKSPTNGKTEMKYSLTCAACIAAVLTLWTAPGSLMAEATGPQCGVPPTGVVNAADDPEPQQPIWCVSGLAPQTTSGRMDPFGGWLDNFDNNGQIGSFRDGELGYRVFDDIDGSSTSTHFVANNYWIVDLAKQSNLQG